MTIPPVNETTLEGSTVKLRCVSKNPLATTSWFKDNVPVLEVAELKERIQILPEGSLYIVGAEMKDSGYYSCEVSNEEGKKQAAGAYLNVQCKY